jgi:hypothetical protein
VPETGITENHIQQPALGADEVGDESALSVETVTSLDLHFGRDANITNGFHLEFLHRQKIRAVKSARRGIIAVEPLDLFAW